MNRFAQVPIADIQRSTFSRDNTAKLTMDSGYLVPCFIDEVLPGDTFNLSMDVFARMSTPVVPFMDDIYFDTFFFFVPNRLVWDEWEYFMGASKNGKQYKLSDYAMPCIICPEGGFPVEGMADYFGLPTEVGGLTKITALPFRAYNLIFREWFMDANLYTEADIPVLKTDSTNDDYSLYPLLKRGKRHDYFTSALPWPMKPDGDLVDVPIGISAPVVGNGMTLGLTNGTINYGTELVGTASVAAAESIYGSFISSTGQVSPAGNSGIVGVTTDPDKSGLIADLTSSSAVSINDLRRAFMLQKFLETSARGGNNRYTEILRSHFSVVSPDARLQRPEYLGGGSGMVMVSQVPQTSSTASGETPQGNLAAYAYYSGEENGFSRSFVEHGFVIGFINIRANLTYQQGIERFWTREDRYDYYWPEFAHLGEQEVNNREIFAQGTDDDDGVFGYQERYAEYRYKPSRIMGKFRSSYAQSLDVWHLSQYFDTLPKLSIDFIQEDPPIDRVIAVPSEPQFKVDLKFYLNTVRPMPVFGIPGFTAHF